MPSPPPADAPGADLTGLAGWAIAVIRTLGVPGVALLIAVENVFPPIPSEVVLPLAGFLAGRGDLPVVAVVLGATVGSIVGALALYGVARAVGEERVRGLVERAPLVRLDDLDRAESWFERHGAEAVLLGRLAPVVRSLVSIPAGLQGMPVLQFVAYTGVGSGVWNAVFVGLGFLLGSQWKTIGRYSTWINALVVAAITFAVGVFVVRRLRERHRRR